MMQIITHLHALQDDVVQRRAAGCAVLPHPGVLQDLVCRRSSLRILRITANITVASYHNKKRTFADRQAMRPTRTAN